MTAPHPVPGAASCSALSTAIDEPLAGTARHASAWLLIEQPGSWGKNALLDSHLPVGVGQAIVDATTGTGTEPLLIRRPGPHADPLAPAARTVLLASVSPDHRWMRRWTLPDDAALSSWVDSFDASAASRGEAPPGGQAWTVPTLALCTNARRDLCCALAGRALLDDLMGTSSDAPPGWLWECSHLGGHRFAPTALALPTGLVLGRADAAACQSALAGAVPHTHARGFSWLEPQAQVADLAVRHLLGEHADQHTLSVDGGQGSRSSHWRVTSAHGPAWIVDVDAVPLPARPPSCGKPDEAGTAFIARSVIPAS